VAAPGGRLPATARCARCALAPPLLCLRGVREAADDDLQVVRASARQRGLAAGVPGTARDLCDVQHLSPMRFRAHVHLGRVRVEVEAHGAPAALGGGPSPSTRTDLLRAAHAVLREHAQSLRPEDGSAPGFERKLPKAVLQPRQLPSPLAARWLQRGAGAVLACVVTPDGVHVLTDAAGAAGWDSWEEVSREEVVDAFVTHLTETGRETCADGEFGRSEWTA